MKRLIFTIAALGCANIALCASQDAAIIQATGVSVSISMLADPQEKPGKDVGLELDEQPVPLKTVAPKYPESARKDTLEGTVYLKVQIAKDGSVAAVSVLKSTNSVFDAAAIEAMKQWKFKPPMVKGAPVSTEVVVPFKFKLDAGEKKK